MLKTEEANVTQIVMSPSMIVIVHFLHLGKFWGFSWPFQGLCQGEIRRLGASENEPHTGSLGPLQSTIAASFSLGAASTLSFAWLSFASMGADNWYVLASSNKVLMLAESSADPKSVPESEV